MIKGLTGLAATAACLVGAGPAHALTLKVNFQPSSSTVPSGYSVDSGGSFTTTRTYGWVRQDSLSTATHVPVTMTDRTRERNVASDQRLDTLVQIDDTKNTGNGSGAWEAVVPNGRYTVTVGAGDPSAFDSTHRVNVEGTQLINFVATTSLRQQTATTTVNVADGRLTLDAIGGTNTKIDYVDIATATVANTGTGITTLTSSDPAPYSDRLVFNRIGSVSAPPTNGVHDQATETITNTGSGPLKITALTLSSTSWQFIAKPALPATIAAGATLPVAIKYVSGGGRLSSGTLNITSDSATTPTSTVTLAGFWQPVSENGGEPKLAEIVNTLFGYKTNIGPALNNAGHVQASGEEILSPYWRRVDTSQPVNVTQIAAEHTQGNTAKIGSFLRGAPQSSAKTFLTHAGIDSQSLLPHKDGSTTDFAQASFVPPAEFGLRLDMESSDPTQNDTSADVQNGCVAPCGHRVRIWPLRGRDNLVVPNTWIVTMDYHNVSGSNYDYNDNVYIMTNMTPDTDTQPTLYRTDTGASTSFTDSRGRLWSPDTGLFGPSNAIAEGNATSAIANTVDDKIYSSYRGNTGTSTPVANRILDYTFPTTATRVDVRLHFAERAQTAANVRVFNVYAEEQLRLANEDLFARIGAKDTAWSEAINGVNITGGSLRLHFTTVKDFPSIAGIEVLCAAGC